MNAYTIGWAIIAAAWLAVETTAIARQDHDGTFTRLVRRIRGKRYAWRWWLFTTATVWAVGHLLFDAW